MLLSPGNSLLLSGEHVIGKKKKYNPSDFLIRAEKLTLKYLDNEMLLKNIRGSLKNLEVSTQGTTSAPQSLKTEEQTAMFSSKTDKPDRVETEKSLRSNSIQSRMLHKSQASQPHTRTFEKKHKNSKFRVTSHPGPQTIDQIKNLFSGVVQIKVEPNIRIITNQDKEYQAKHRSVKTLKDSKVVVCHHCNHYVTDNGSQAPSMRSGKDKRFSARQERFDTEHAKPNVYRPRSDTLSSGSHQGNRGNSFPKRNPFKVMSKDSGKKLELEEGYKRPSTPQLIEREKNKEGLRETKASQSEQKAESLKDLSTNGQINENNSPPKRPDKPAIPLESLRINSGIDQGSMIKKTDDNFSISSPNIEVSLKDLKKMNIFPMGLGEDSIRSGDYFTSENKSDNQIKLSKFQASAQLGKANSLDPFDEQPVPPAHAYWYHKDHSEYYVRLHKTISERM